LKDVKQSPAIEAVKSMKEGVAGGSVVKSHGSGGVPIDMDAAVFVSICTWNRICGNSFCLEDGSSMMAEDEALMWFEVTPFSPLTSHHRICPF
jgi:hypothetical protein